MITFNKSQTNRVVVTLTENSTVTSPVYLFEFKNQQSGLSYYFIADDISIYKQRYNEFNVTETTNPNTLNGEIELGNEGFYDYNIYQTSLYSINALQDRMNVAYLDWTCLQNEIDKLEGLTTAEDAIPHITKLVETGLVWVVPNANAQTNYEPQITQTIIYNG